MTTEMLSRHNMPQAIPKQLESLHLSSCPGPLSLILNALYQFRYCPHRKEFVLPIMKRAVLKRLLGITRRRHPENFLEDVDTCRDSQPILGLLIVEQVVNKRKGRPGDRAQAEEQGSCVAKKMQVLVSGRASASISKKCRMQFVSPWTRGERRPSLGATATECKSAWVRTAEPNGRLPALPES